MKKILTLTIISLMASSLTACGGDDSKTGSSTASTTASTTASKTVAKLANSKLTKFMKEDSVCAALSLESIQKAFNVATEIKTSAGYNKYSKSVSCYYEWDKADAKEREDNFLSYSMDQMQGKGKKLTMRQRSPQSNITLSLGEFKFTADRFVPRKLTDEQLQVQIAAAKKRADERLTDEQKKVAGKAANLMMENLLKKNNQNKEVMGVGEKAYWSSVGGGGLYVLSGNTKISVSLMIADTEAEDLENAKKIAQLLL